MFLKSNKFKSKIQNWFYFKHLISKDIKDIKEIKKDINTKKQQQQKKTLKKAISQLRLSRETLFSSPLLKIFNI